MCHTVVVKSVLFTVQVQLNEKRSGACPGQTSSSESRASRSRLCNNLFDSSSKRPREFRHVLRYSYTARLALCRLSVLHPSSKSPSWDTVYRNVFCSCSPCISFVDCSSVIARVQPGLDTQVIGAADLVSHAAASLFHYWPAWNDFVANLHL
ncbi:hypothetical protein BS17DRAFT_94449 [Gyrodon lividus]|nr:hypothetical protein BS17DRAFT_94449 [Gyrodon lividus]